MIERMCRGNSEALDALDRAVKGKQGKRTDLVDNVHEVKQPERPAGNTAEAALRRLCDQAPALHSRVLAGELSPHAAMIEAGFRKRTITIKADPVGHPMKRHIP